MKDCNSYEMTIGTFKPLEFENKCCKDKPFRIVASFGDGAACGYYCECECGLWCTTWFKDPVRAIMQYELMCRKYPDVIQFDDPNLIENYMKYYTRKERLRPAQIKAIVSSIKQEEQLET